MILLIRVLSSEPYVLGRVSICEVDSTKSSAQWASIIWLTVLDELSSQIAKWHVKTT